MTTFDTFGLLAIAATTATATVLSAACVEQADLAGGDSQNATDSGVLCDYRIDPAVPDDAEILEEQYASPAHKVTADELDTLDELAREQIRIAVEYCIEEYELDFLEGPDEDTVFLMDVCYEGMEYDWVKFYLGDTEFGIVYAVDSLDFVAGVSDGDVYGCQ